MEVIFVIISVIFLYYFFKFIFSGNKEKSKLEKDLDLIKYVAENSKEDSLKMFKESSAYDSITEMITEMAKQNKNDNKAFYEKLTIDNLFYKFCFHKNVYKSIITPSDNAKAQIALELVMNRLERKSFSTSVFTSFLNKELNLNYVYQDETLTNIENGDYYDFIDFNIPVEGNNYINILEIEKDLIEVDFKSKLSAAKAFILYIIDGLPTKIFVLIESPIGFTIREVLANEISNQVLMYDEKIDDEDYSLIYFKLIKYLGE